MESNNNNIDNNKSRLRALISTVLLANKYVRSEVFRHVSLIHRQLNITNVFNSSDISSLYHYVQCNDTTKFIHYCDQLDITVHSPEELLDTVNDAFKHAFHRQNITLVKYILERFRLGNNTTVDKFKDYVRGELFMFLQRHASSMQHIKLSQSMIHTLFGYTLSYGDTIIPPYVLDLMMRSALVDHDDSGLCSEIYQHHPLHTLSKRPLFEWYVYFGYMIASNPWFARHQSMINDDFQAYLLSPPPAPTPSSNDPPSYNLNGHLAEFAIRQQLYDLLIKIAKHTSSINARSLTAIEHPITLDTLLALATRMKLTLFNQLAAVGDISFMKHVLHLMPEYIDHVKSFEVGSQSQHHSLFNTSMLQCALTGGHYECACYILDNFTQFLQQLNPTIGFNHKWLVTGINMRINPSNTNHNHHNWLEMFDMLVNNVNVDHIFFDLYMNAIVAKRLDVIDRLEQLIDNSTITTLIDINLTFNTALQQQYVDAIKTIIHNRPGHKFKGINIEYFDQCTSDVQDMILTGIDPGCLDFQLDKSPKANVSASTIRMLIKHQHHTHCWSRLLKSAELQDERELVDILAKQHDATPYQTDPWLLGYELTPQVNPYHRLLVPPTSSEFQQYQSILNNLGVINPSS
ncbi:hypothetical protein SAMD00019534_092900 [Acytostelium subglobosum LB1]|uniref:hypothetical protein n=1 Tax=Acytostelium subglobosum LB1 TaxID=1410327 RepID=UPI0006449B19|nr:hypothetical protein SAMD00019534_092900 [Acytostelium subglobosum LB1]GAM26115.1 hypothetical protein SAMD00019534_092900 [Acytostelium subglobosum LB1]|eukprot:XP_012751158.1 hypothetical protein SAMD00019534_092900 [Acytostelium subglobosum LB1]